jgi:hypothetical protein
VLSSLEPLVEGSPFSASHCDSHTHSATHTPSSELRTHASEGPGFCETGLRLFFYVSTSAGSRG